ncbi:MAG: MFS transporter [Polyangiaceae bacterium]|nr:MFS transporter [Polyangiaceae bacterium]
MEARTLPRVAARRRGDEAILPGSSLTITRAIELFDAQATSRHIDYAARWLRSKGAGFYTIGSAGHEGNAAVAAATRPTDPALLHYRSGAFFLERARQRPAEIDPVRAILLGIVAGTQEPIAGGRHKVFGSRALEIIPQTSTIASHLPRAVGLALSMERAKKLKVSPRFEADSIVVTSFGDASANHSTLTGAVNAACHCAYQNLPMPVLFVCEDNGIGISVETPPGWIRAAYGERPNLTYIAADGCDLVESYDASVRAAELVRTSRRPVFLHLSLVRLMGHAGSDAEAAYRSPQKIREDLSKDPLLRAARLLVESGALSGDEVLARYEAARGRVMGIAREVVDAPKLTSAAMVAAPLAPRTDAAVAKEAARQAPEETRATAHEGKLPEEMGPLTLSLAINRGLADVLATYPEAVVFGEDVGRKGGVYGVTKGLAKRFGVGRVFDTLLDEQAILGLALGGGLAGLLPIAEIQYLAYLHNAEDQLRGEGATLQFFSQGAYRNPMVVRIAGYGYQKGFGGHFHNDDSVTVLRDIPGIVIASPSRPDDAASMLRTCVASAKVDGSVCVFLEPIALYHTRDWHEEGDAAFLASYPRAGASADTHVPIGRGRTYGDGRDLTIVTFANGVYMSLRVAERLRREGIDARVLDLRWLAPLPTEDLLREANASGKVLIVDETRRSGGVSEGILAALVDARFSGKMRRVTSEDCFIPLGDAALTVLLSEETIEAAARELVRG